MIKKLIVGAIVGLVTVATAFSGQVAFATVNCPNGGTADTLAQCSLPDDKRSNTLMIDLQKVINIILSVLGIIAVIVIIIGGFTYMTSAGDSAKLTKAKNTILYGIVGLVIALLAFAIVNFVLASVFKTTTT